MTLEQAQLAFSALAVPGQARFLATLAHELTVWTRSAYPELLADPDLVISRLRAGNELQHRVTAQVAHLLNQDPGRYPDDVFVAILFDFARPAGCEDQLTKLFQDLYCASLRQVGNGDAQEAPAQPAAAATFSGGS